jgi:DnaJ-class molecular chaperone
MAVLGGDIIVETVAGDVKLKIPKGTQSGLILGLRVRVRIILMVTVKGVHYVRVNLNVPTKLDRKRNNCGRVGEE